MKHKPLVRRIIIAILILIIALGILSILNDRNSQIDDLKASNKTLSTNLADQKDETDRARTQTTQCRIALTTAWETVKRRNDLVSQVLGNVLSENNTADIAADNSQVQSDFASTVPDCDSTLTFAGIFGY